MTTKDLPDNTQFTPDQLAKKLKIAAQAEQLLNFVDACGAKAVIVIAEDDVNAVVCRVDMGAAASILRAASIGIEAALVKQTRPEHAYAKLISQSRELAAAQLSVIATGELGCAQSIVAAGMVIGTVGEMFGGNDAAVRDLANHIEVMCQELVNRLDASAVVCDCEACKAQREDCGKPDNSLN